jgi:L-lactate dehydrogenase complex protein LldF
MTGSPKHFRSAAREALQSPQLQSALDGLSHSFVAQRQHAVASCSDFERLRNEGRAVRQRTLRHLDQHLESFERTAKATGTQVHWAETAEAARQTIGQICANHAARKIAKGKSMVSEEIGLNAYLQSRGLEVVETDLGEYLIQLRQEAPSHIIAPAIHLTTGDATETFKRHHKHLPEERPLDTPEDMVAEVRSVMRQHFLSADIGITGANFLVAESGSAVVVTNEGNGDLSATLPKVHIIVAAIDKIVPTLQETGILLQLLARSATGQTLTAYTSIFTGPKAADDQDGPNEHHIILLDNGRSDLLASDKSDVLTCIRCGACLNHCPIYRSVGGHSYGSVYPGPIGAILTPALLGPDVAKDLPHASSLCGRCEEVCPVRIPIPDILRRWRADIYTQSGGNYVTKIGLRLWRWTAMRPHLYHRLTRLAARVLRTRKGYRQSLGLAPGWTRYRHFPASTGETFQEQWRRRQRKTMRGGPL